MRVNIFETLMADFILDTDILETLTNLSEETRDFRITESFEI